MDYVGLMILLLIVIVNVLIWIGLIRLLVRIINKKIK